LDRRALSAGAIKTFIDDLGEYIAGQLVTPSWPDSVPGAIYDAVCSHILGTGAALIPEIAAVMEASEFVFLALAIPTGPAGWLATLAFAVALNLLIAEVFPQITAAVSAACDALKPCAIDPLVNFATDPKNCGGCDRPVRFPTPPPARILC
jgi:hypothetical protein